MEIKTTLIGLVAVAICVFPFLYILIKSKKKQMEQVALLQSVAKSFNSELGAFDLARNLCIGLAADDKYVFILKQSDPDYKEIIPLTEVKSCAVNKVTRKIKTPDGPESVIDKLELAISFAKKNPLAIEFFDLQNDLQLDGELQLTQKWESLINSKLKLKA